MTRLMFPPMPLDGSGEWTAPPDVQAAIVATYGDGPDVQHQLNKARTWLIANPTRRKTKRGMARYLNNWLSNSGLQPRDHAGDASAQVERLRREGLAI